MGEMQKVKDELNSATEVKMQLLSNELNLKLILSRWISFN